MPLTTIVWLALLVALALLFLVTVRRMSTLIARTRGLERFQRMVESIDRRFAATINPLVHGLDETRRSPGDPATLSGQVAAAQRLIAELVAEVCSVPAPGPLAPAAAVLAGQLDRAERAAALVEHGLNMLATPTRGRDLEAQTSLKRGALNLRNAHEAFGRVATEVAALRPADLAGGGPLPRVGAAALTTYPVNDEDDAEGRLNPRM